MKRTVYIAAAFMMMTACSGHIDPAVTEEPVIPEDYEGPYTLTADKTEVEASGKDYVTFSLLDAYDRDLMVDEKALQNVKIISEDGTIVPRMTSKVSYIANGTIKYTATFKGKKSVNELTITAKNRSRYEKFHKNVAIYKATATWCTACPAMTAAIEGIDDDAKKHSVQLCCHSGDHWEIPDCGSYISMRFGDNYLPTVVLDLLEDAVIPVTEKSSSAVERTIMKVRTEYPATCGIRLSTAYDSKTGRVYMTAELTSSTGGEYDLGFALLHNDQVFVNDYNERRTYSHIVTDKTDNFRMYTGAGKSVAKDGKFSSDHSFVLPVGLGSEEFSVVAYAVVRNGDNGARIDNIVEVQVGKSLDYVYNE